MKQVTNHFMELSASEREKLLEEQRQKSEWVLKYQREYARQEARKKIMEEGMQKGRKEGLKEGMEQSREKIVLQMLKEKADMDLISRVTGLTKEKILKLKAENSGKSKIK